MNAYKRIDFKAVLKAAMNPSPETERLARKAIRHLEAEKKKMDRMTPAQRRKYINKWAHRLAKECAKMVD